MKQAPIDYDIRLRNTLLVILGLLIVGMCVTSIMILRSQLAYQSSIRPPDNQSQPVFNGGEESVTPTTAPPSATSIPTKTPVPTQPPPAPCTPDMDIEALLGRMTMEEKIGQMIMTGVSGQSLGPADAEALRQYHFGGIVYFGGNVSTPEQVHALSSELQALAAQNGAQIPLLIGLDHEGGNVFRFKSGASHFPSYMAIGATNNVDLAAQAAGVVAAELQAAGINVIFGPVLDINSDPNNPIIGLRSFGSSTELVSVMGERTISSLQQAGIIAVAKHFPGHGATSIDSHLIMPQIDLTMEQLHARELVPFQAAIRQQVSGVMVAHTANTLVDPSGLPASLSEVFVRRLLREELGYSGLIFTDSLSMGAVGGSYKTADAAVLAVKAGIDVLTFNEVSVAAASWSAIFDAVARNEISEERINESVRRILSAKACHRLFSSAATASSVPTFSPNPELARDIARSAIVSIHPATYPLIQEKRVLIISPDKVPLGSVNGDNLTLLGESLIARGLEVEEWIYSVEDPAQAETIRQQALAQAPNYPLVIVLTWDARLRSARFQQTVQEQMVQDVAQAGVRAIYVAVSLPYDLGLYPEGAPALATFGALPVQIEELVNALLSPEPPKGTLPVDIDP